MIKLLTLLVDLLTFGITYYRRKQKEKENLK